MTARGVLERAKAFLCWDCLPGLSVQLIEMTEGVSFFHPPMERQTVIVYYAKGCEDFTAPLFLLFHEAGHGEQYGAMAGRNRASEFERLMNDPGSPSRAAFEKQAWDLGRAYLERFILRESLPGRLLADYDAFARVRIEGYGPAYGATGNDIE